MSSIPEQVADDHRPVWVEQAEEYEQVVCKCDNKQRFGWRHTEHVASVTERLVREQVAAEIRAQRHEAQRESLGRIESNGWWSLHGQIGAYDHAARIAEAAT